VQQLYCGRGHPLFGRQICLPSDLCDEAFVMTGQDEPEELERFRRRYGLGSHAGGFAENLHEVTRLIELGVGIGFLPTCVADPMVEQGRVWPLLAADLLPSYHVFLVTREASSRNTPTEIFIGEVMKRLRQLPPDL